MIFFLTRNNNNSTSPSSLRLTHQVISTRSIEVPERFGTWEAFTTRNRGLVTRFHLPTYPLGRAAIGGTYGKYSRMDSLLMSLPMLESINEACKQPLGMTVYDA